MNRRPPRDDFKPTAALATLRLRAGLLRALRGFFEAEGYWEVETPILSHDVVVDAHLEPFSTYFREAGVDIGMQTGSSNNELFLQTSPEFGMKRLLAAGADAIYQFSRVMRRGESGRLHNPEFTMIEWYRVGDTHHEQMTFVERLVTAMHDTVRLLQSVAQSPSAGGSSIKSAGPSQSFERITYDEVFQRHLGCPVLKLTAGQLRELASSRRGSESPDLGDDRDGWLNYLLAEFIEPQLGRECPAFIYDYPASQAALARIRRDDPPVAERFELYMGGLEICNGYHELTDADELRQRMRRQNVVRAAQGRRRLPETNRLLDAMDAGLPPCSGVALGFDRLMMVLIGAERVADVLAFPVDRA